MPSKADDDGKLTAQEEKVSRLLVEAWNELLILPELNEWDRQEFMFAIHQAQNIILARPTVRRWTEDNKND